MKKQGWLEKDKREKKEYIIKTELSCIFILILLCLKHIH